MTSNHEQETAVADSSTNEWDVAIVGGGVIGCAIARELADDHDVVLLEQGQLAGEATGRAAGEITIAPSYTDRPEIGDYATDFFRQYDGTGDFEFVERPSLELVPPEREGEARRRVERLASEGANVAFLEAETVEREYPRFDLGAASSRSRFVGAVRHGDTGFVDPYTLTTTLASEAEAAGAEIRTGTAVRTLVFENDRVTGLETEDGPVSAPRVVVAAGWRTQPFLRKHAGLEIPVRPYRTQCLVLEPPEPLTEAFPMGWLPGEHVYFRPELNGDLLVGGWSFATDEPEMASPSADPEFREHVAALLPRFLRSFDDSRIVNGWAGVDGATPDTRPIVDAPADGPDGLLVATGFHGRGVMTAPVTAALIRAFVTGESSPVSGEPFALERFEDRSPDFEFVSISDGGDDY